MSRRVAGIVLLAFAVGACSSGDSDDGGPQAGWIDQIGPAMAAVEAELGGPQEYFEVTATEQLVNLFVAADDGTAAVPYVFLAGALREPGPQLDGAAGETFVAADLPDIVAGQLLSKVSEEVPTGTIESVSIEGGAGSAVRFVLSVRSQEGGVLDVIVDPDGSIVSVEPV